MNRASTEKDFYEARDEAKKVFTEIQNAVRQRAARGAVVPRMGGGQPGPAAPPPDGAAPRVRKYNPATGQIE
jgi:hypothetical protein